MDNRLIKFTKWLLDIMFYVGAVLTVMIPWLFRIFGRYMETFRKYYVAQCLVYMISGVLCLKIVYELRKMFRTILDGDAFVEANARSLKLMSKCSFFYIGAVCGETATVAYTGYGGDTYRVCHCGLVQHYPVSGIREGGSVQTRE